MMLRVLLADDHALMRAGLVRLLGGLDGVAVVAEAADGHEALRLAHARQPDIALLDITMPSLNGVAVARRLRDELPQVRCILLSMHAGESFVQEAKRAGAQGYVLKDAALADLEQALRAVAAGGTWFTGVIAEAARRVDDVSLSPRQTEVLQMIAEGWSTRAIADRLALSTKTIETHRAQIMDKLGIHDVAGLTRYAVRNGLIDAER